MKILVTGGDGFCGWPTSLHLSAAGHDVLIVDNLSRRAISERLGYESLTPIRTIQERVRMWLELTGRTIAFRNVDLAGDPASVRQVVVDFDPHCIVHLAAQRSAPYSMKSVECGNYTLGNNMLSTNNVLSAIAKHDRPVKMVSLGSIGIYGYEDRHYEIPEGRAEFSGVDGNGVGYEIESAIPFHPTSLYHLSKSQITSLLSFYARSYGIDITDLYQGIVWGTQTTETAAADELSNRFDYDEIYGTVLNRFVVQARSDMPMTVYGEGEQTRAFIHIQDTVRCIEVAVNCGASNETDVNVMHQISETRTIRSVAERVARLTGAKIEHVTNPRGEVERHRYTLANAKFRQLGVNRLKTLENGLIDEIDGVIGRHLGRIERGCIAPRVKWNGTDRKRSRTTIEDELEVI